MGNGFDKSKEFKHVLDESSVVSSTDFTGLLQGIPKDKEDISDLKDIHNIPEQGGLKELELDPDVTVK